MPKNRGVTGRFLPGGPSPNPNGRPKGIAALVQAETRDGGELVGYLLRVLRDKDQKTELRMQAAQVLLDRGFGKAVQQVEGTFDGTLATTVDATVVHLEAVRAHVEEADVERLTRALLGTDGGG
jgi:hypothetical protein